MTAKNRYMNQFETKVYRRLNRTKSEGLIFAIQYCMGFGKIKPLIILFCLMLVSFFESTSFAKTGPICVDFYSLPSITPIVHPARRISPPAYFLGETDPILRRVSSPIDIDQIHIPQFQLLISRMMNIIESSKVLGVAAPQIGISQQVVVARLNTSTTSKDTSLVVMINPKLEIVDPTIRYRIEESFSIPGRYGLVGRPKSISVEFFDLQGKKKKIVLADLAARIVQHEVDHLAGVLYTDRAKFIVNPTGLLLEVKPAPDFKEILIQCFLYWHSDSISL